MLLATAAVIGGLGAAAAHAATPIDTNQPYYPQSQVGVTVTPDFKGGTLRDDQNNVTDANTYTVENFPTNTIDAYGNTTTYSGTFSGAGPLTITDSRGGGTVVVTGGSTIGGTLTINSGATLQWGNGVSAGFLVGPSNAVTDNGTLVLNLGGGGINGSVPISGTGSVVVQSGSFTDSGVSTYTGATTIGAAGTLSLSGSGSISASSGVADSGIFDISGTTSGASITALSGAGLVSLGGKTLTLTNANGTFSGTFADGGIYGGTGGSVIIAGGSELVTGSSNVGGTVTINSGATLQWGNGSALGYLLGSGNTLVDNGTLAMNFGGGGLGGSIQISGTGSVALLSGSLNDSGVSTYTGATTIGANGLLLLSGSGSIANSSGVADNGSFDISGTTSGASITSLSGGGKVALGAQTLTVTGGSGTFSGVIQDAGLFSGTGGGLVVAGGTQTLSGTNTYTGDTTINSGATLQLGAGGTTGSVAGNITDNGLLKFNYGGSVTFANTVSGTGAIEVAGGTVVATNSSFVSGTVTIDNGATLQWGNGGPAFLVGAGNAVVDNGTLVMSFGGGGIGGSIPISGTGSVVIQSGSLNDAGVSTYTGSTTIGANGVFILSGTGSIAASSGVADSGTLDISGTTAGASITTLTGAGSVKLGSQTLTLTGPGGTFSGVIADGGLFGGTGGGLTLGGGTAILTGTNTYTGSTTINGGATLQLGAGGTTGSVAGNITDNGLLKFNYGGSVTFANTVSGTGAIEVAGGTVVATNSSFVSGTVTIDNGATLQWGNGSGPAYLVGGGNALVDNGTLVMNFGGGGVGVAAPIAGTGTVVLQSGAFTEGAAATYTGATTIGANGYLYLQAAGSIANSSGVANSGTLDISGTTAGGSSISALTGGGVVKLGGKSLTLTGASGTFSGAIADGGLGGGTGGSLVVAGGTQVLSGTNTYTGGTTINSGATLQLGAGGTSGSVVGSIIDNGALTFNRSDVNAVSNVISGTGTLKQAGTGTTVLNGVNTISGLTTVSAGMLEIGDALHPGAVLDSHVGGVTVGAGGTLAGHGTVVGAVTNSAGGTVAPGGTIGTLAVGSYVQGASSTLAIEVSPAAASKLAAVGTASLSGKLALTFDPGVYGGHIYPIVTSGVSVSGTFSSVTASGQGVLYGISYGAKETDLVTAPSDPAQVYGVVSTATLDRAHGFASLVEDRFGQAGCTDDKGSDHCQGPGVWAQAIASSDRLGENGASFGFSNTAAGAVGGADHRWMNGAVVGAAFGYESANLSMPAASAKGQESGYYGALYGRWLAGPVHLDGQAFYMRSDWTISREVMGFSGAQSSPNGDTVGVLAQASVPLADGLLRPYVRVAWAQFDRGATTETGSGTLGFAVNGSTDSVGRAEFGVLLAHTYTTSAGLEIRPALQLGVQRAFGDLAPSATVGLTGVVGASTVVGSVRAAETAGVGDFSIKLRVNQKFEFSADLRGRVGTGQTEGAVGVGGHYRF